MKLVALAATALLALAATCHAQDVTEAQLDTQWAHIEIHFGLGDSGADSILDTQSELVYWIDMLDDEELVDLAIAGEIQAQYAMDRTEQAAEYHLQALDYYSQNLDAQATLCYGLAQDELEIADDHWAIAVDILYTVESP